MTTFFENKSTWTKTMKKIVLIIVCACLASSCGSFPENIRIASYQYDGKYTGIDTLINIAGHYSHRSA